MDQFRRIFLEQLEIILNKEPSKQTQLEILQLSTPGIVESQLRQEHERQKLFRKLLASVHPDKHPRDAERATRLCQKVQQFYLKCESTSPSREKKRRRPPSSSGVYPIRFSAYEKWPHITWNQPQSYSDISTAVGYQLINIRLAIVHGKKPNLSYQNCTVKGSVEDIIGSFSKVKYLCEIDEIKEEIITRGPVVTTSFRPNNLFPQYLKARPLLIVGWDLNTTGEFWKVQSLCEYNPLDIAMGQFGIDDCCLAPIDNLENQPCDVGPYFDINLAMSVPTWRSSNRMNVSVSLTEFSTLLSQMKKIAFDGRTNLVTVRDKSKIAHSRRGYVNSLEQGKTENRIAVEIIFSD